MSRSRTFLVCLTLLLAPYAHAATYTETSVAGLTARLPQLQPGDTLILGNGSYPIQLHSLFGTRFPSGTAAKPITLKAATPGQAIFNPSARADTYNILYIENAQYLIFDGLVLDGAGIRDARGMNLFKTGPGANYITFQNGVVRNGKVSCSGAYSSGGCGYSQGLSGGGTGMVFKNNEIYNLDAYGVYWLGDHSLIEGNYIHDNNGYGVHVYKSGASDVNGNIVRKNRIVHNGWNNRNPAGSCGVVLASGSSNVACGNEVSDHDGCGVQVYSTAVETRVFGNRISGTVGPAIEDAGRGTVLDAPATSAASGGDACGGLPFSGTSRGARPAPTHLRALAVR